MIANASRAAALSLVLVSSLCGCGSAPPPVAEKPFETPLKQTSPADVCLATAAAKREKKPNEPQKITAKHVLVKYAGAKKADASVKRTREEACLRAMEARDKVRGGEDFGKVVAAYSEEPGAATREGSVGGFERGMMAPPFEDAAFELDVNQLSDVVETDFGFHVILRTQ